MPNPSVAQVVTRLTAAPPRLGHTRLALVDGPAGAGKTTLATSIGREVGAQVVHGDDIYEGWAGLATMWPILGHEILEPLAAGTGARFLRWDWDQDRRGEVVEIPPAQFLVIEGVGVAQRAARPFASLVIYVDAPKGERLQRGLERDGADMREQWQRWQAAEAPLLESEGAREAADVVIDGTAPVEGMGASSCH